MDEILDGLIKPLDKCTFVKLYRPNGIYKVNSDSASIESIVKLSYWDDLWGSTG